MNKQSLLFIIGILGVVGAVIGFLVWQSGKTGSVTDEERYTLKNAVPAPDFTLPDIDGNKITLSGLHGKNVVLFFNDGLTCYPCLEQIAELSADQRLNNRDTAALSIVMDSPKDWEEAEKELAFLSGARVLTDAGGKAFQAYAVLNLSSAMKGPHAGHTYFIIDKEGMIRFVLDDPYMGIRNNLLADEISKIDKA